MSSGCILVVHKFAKSDIFKYAQHKDSGIFMLFLLLFLIELSTDHANERRITCSSRCSRQRADPVYHVTWPSTLITWSLVSSRFTWDTRGAAKPGVELPLILKLSLAILIQPALPFARIINTCTSRARTCNPPGRRHWLHVYTWWDNISHLTIG